MKRKVRERERELFRKSMELRRFNLSKTKWEQAQEIRKQQNDMWKRGQFFKGVLDELDKKGD